ncbi:IS256 family transposase [Legionella israelensis]|uniref:Mutator family transposase n=1 Tax=Legionella israelensis TaxID=454 RepID=A0AAX1ED66_9GAMM|nr:IS256 family transposase [Legionella israelensis]QBR82941.1 IS256 family transposase [Legionella israelensis]QBR83018.1 IS256 family transposase [Legionella israelensis]QBR84742.1 IS256 family transposase [Legionella israelensis]QBR84792.1 IS256 family transposase [Legionella israelensis]
MSDVTENCPTKPETNKDPLTALLRKGARELISQAVEAELELLLENHKDVVLSDGRKAVVRNGYLPERTVQTGIGDVPVKVPKIRDRSRSGIKFNSNLLPPYLKRTRSMEELIPWLYLKGVSTGDYSEALAALLGDGAKGLSTKTICRLKQKWLDEYGEWSNQDLSNKRYVYWWADGIYSAVRQDDRLCLLVIIGVTETGKKELVAVEDGYRESTDSWEELLTDLCQRGLKASPKLAVGDGAMGFWKALAKVYSGCRQQRCWVHKTANVLDKLPKSMQPKVKSALHDIYLSETREAAYKAFDNTVAKFEAKYPKAMECLKKDREELLAFYDFPAEHWMHIRTTNPIESAFATVRLRTKKSKNCGSRETTLSMVFKLLESAEKRWRKIKGFRLLPLVANDVTFENGEQIGEEDNRKAA